MTTPMDNSIAVIVDDDSVQGDQDLELNGHDGPDSDSGSPERANLKDMRDFPPFVVEVTTSGFRKLGRSRCHLLGGLHPTRVPFIRQVHVVRGAATGCVIYRALSTNPHYNIHSQQEAA